MMRVSFKIILLLFMLLHISLISTAEQTNTIQKHSIGIKNLGKIILIYHNDQGADTTQLILEKPGGLRTIIKTFEGLIPNSLFKADLDVDSFPEFVVVLKDLENTESTPIIYGTKTQIAQIYPEPNQDNNKLVCTNAFLTNYNKQNVLCTKSLINHHDFGPPNLYQFRYFNIKANKLNQITESFSNSKNFNILMNKGGFFFYKGKYFQAINHYSLAIASSTDKIHEAAKVEALFFQAQSSKYVKNFIAALKTYQTIVINFEQNQWTDRAQREIELISSNLMNKKALSLWVDIANQVQRENWLNASEMFEQISIPKASPSLQARFLFMNAEVCVALNNIDKAIAIYHKIIEKFPDLPIAEIVKTTLQDLEVKPEEADGL